MAGEILRSRREELGLTLSDVSGILKIKKEYLSALEADDLKKLPALVYTAGYIRAYSRHLGINGDALIDFYTENLTAPRASTIVPIGYSQKKIPAFFYVVVTLIIVGISLLGYIYIYIPRGLTKEQPRPSVQEKAIAEQPAIVVQPVTTFAQPEMPVVQPAVPAEKPKENSLTITADETTWVLIKFKDGKSQDLLMQPNEKKSWHYSDSAFLKVGNAGGIMINLNGKDLGPAGKTGEVKMLYLPEN